MNPLLLCKGRLSSLYWRGPLIVAFAWFTWGMVSLTMWLLGYPGMARWTMIGVTLLAIPCAPLATKWFDEGRGPS